MRATALLLGVLLAVVATSISAGELEPPGPPAPTMKTLEDVEARIPIRAADLPLTIATPGSYYLAESIAVTNDVVVINNTCSGNGRGIYVFRSGNFVVRNVAYGNTSANYEIAAGNAAGAVVTDPAAAGPWDNIEY